MEESSWINPFKDLRIIIDKGPIQGDLQLEEKIMTFTTSFNTLNYDNFKVVATTLKEDGTTVGIGVGIPIYWRI